MKRHVLRILGALILVVSLLTLSGVAATAASFALDQPHTECCDTGGAHPATGDGHSSSPDCPCFACITMILHAPVTVARAAIDAEDLPQYPPPRSTLSAFVRSIDYPPESI
ncbi:hypothetical protein KP001_03965 [Geomonas subterranea]|uniref:DUF2946 domain-containing protein n=1 Tax=Geomonas subterranea TaxID=2847989 RepID=A0ABX8LLX3_9BACT|nr:hypothetical protein [Geomonas subterranea]QXE91705.1 hypothetical protein KP001_03965 [Geomonas subterranea]QXM10202.1 hypothetical protein KP002_03530 [Geomonas subterranea]